MNVARAGPGPDGPFDDDPFVRGDTIVEPGGERVLRRQPVVGEEHGTLGRRRDVGRQREIESARPRDKAAAVQIQEPHIGVRAGRDNPFTGDLPDLQANEFDVFDGRLAARAHPARNPSRLKSVVPKGVFLRSFCRYSTLSRETIRGVPAGAPAGGGMSPLSVPGIAAESF